MVEQAAADEARQAPGAGGGGPQARLYGVSSGAEN